MDGRRVRVEHTRDSRFDGDRRGGGDRGGMGGGGGFGRGKVGLIDDIFVFFLIIIIHLLCQPPGARTGYRLVVENLSSSTSWQDLKDYMRQAGEVTYTNTHQNRFVLGISGCYQ